MIRWLKSLFQIPEPAGPPEKIRGCAVSEPTAARDGVSVEGDSLRIESPAQKSFHLFTVNEPGAEQCILQYRAQLRTENVRNGAYLEMWCAFPGMGDFFSKGLHQRLTGSTGWTSCEIPFYLKKGQKPGSVRLGLAFEDPGTVWIKDIELFKTPLR